MIAIMILGIGVVMVATVFPVGIEMTRQPIQAYLRLNIADTAAGTLKAKVPAYREMNAATLGASYSEVISRSTPRVLVPDVKETDIDASMEAIDWEVVGGLFLPGAANTPASYAAPWPLPASTAWPGLTPTNLTEFLKRAKVFTERTGWSAEVDLHPMVNPLGHSGYNTASPVPAQNLPATANVQDMNSIPVMVDPSLAGRYQTDLPRVSLVDQVYPPVTVTYANGNPRDWADTANGPGIRTELRSRQYSWFAFHHRMSSESPLNANKPPANRDILATIAILHRADIGARFARQKTLDSGSDYKVNFNLGDPNNLELMYQPQADEDPQTDAVFPRPWLAMIYQLNPLQGEAYVTPELARMLPAGSFFIIARHRGNADGHYPGTFMEVTRNEWSPATASLGATLNASSPATLASFSAWTRIEITRSSLPSANAVPVWVFPPAITALASPRDKADRYEFSTRSPIVGVELRRIKASQ
jgi:hypothetical protein